MTAPAAETSSQAASSVIAAFEDMLGAAKVSMGKVVASLGGMFGSLGGGGLIVYLVQHLDPAMNAWIVSAIGLGSFGVTFFASAYHFFTHMNATNNATIALAEKGINMAQGYLGLPATDFTAANNGAIPMTSSRAA